MNEIENPERYAQWQQSKAKIFEQHAEIIAARRPGNINGLKYFVQHGEIKLGNYPAPKLANGRSKWESYVNSFLANYALYRFWDFERVSEEKRRFEVVMAKDVFAAHLLSQTIDIFIHWKFPSRSNGGAIQLMQMSSFAFTALGMVIDSREEAVKLAKMQLLAYRKGFYKQSEKYPTIQFMMQILAEFLGEPRHIPNSEGSNFALDELSKNWSCFDSEKIADLCLSVLANRTNENSIVGPKEFEAGWWIFPIEILLVLKLRQLQGLANPDIRHPLMLAPLGVLPSEPANPGDELIDEVALRLSSDGCDMNAVYEGFYGNQSD